VKRSGAAVMRNRWLPRIVVSSAILALLFSFIPFGDVVAALRGADPLFVLLAFGLVPVTTAMSAAQLKVLTDQQGMPLSFSEIVQINLATHFYGIFVPGYLAGGLYRWHRMAQPANQPAQAFAAIAYNRWLETAVILVLGLVFWTLGPPPGAAAGVTPVFIIAMAALALAYLMLFDPRLAAPLRARVGVGRAAPDAGRFRRAAVRALDATGSFGGMSARHTGLAVGLCVLRHLLGVVTFVWFAAAIGVELPFATAGWVQSALLLALMLPIAYAGLGVREAGLVVFLGLFGVDSHDALAISFLLLARTLLGAGMGGIVEAVRAWRPRPAPGD
jgi:glycosyltransferase 2 family protein